MFEESKNSLIYWFPRLHKDDVLRQHLPRTVVIKVFHDFPIDYSLYGSKKEFNAVLKAWFEFLGDVAEQLFGFPVFMRTEYLSMKWLWRNTCFVENKKTIGNNFLELATSQMLKLDIPVKYVVLRQYIRPKHYFKAFNEMPIGREFRFIAHQGHYLCHGFYWPRESLDIDESSELMEQYAKLSEPLSEDDFIILKGLAERATAVLGGAWSVDFMQDEEGNWWLIDVAKAVRSWIPYECRDVVDIGCIHKCEVMHCRKWCHDTFYECAEKCLNLTGGELDG